MIESWSQSLMRLIESDGQICEEVQRSIDSDFLIRLLMESQNSWNPDVVLPCVESILGILINLFYYESKAHVEKLAKLDLVSVLFSLSLCYPQINSKQVYVSLITEMISMRDDAGPTKLSQDFLVKIIGTGLSKIIIQTCLTSTSLQSRSEGVEFFAKLQELLTHSNNHQTLLKQYQKEFLISVMTSNSLWDLQGLPMRSLAVLLHSVHKALT